MELGLSGKRALLTGASRGMGRACAMAIAAEGAEITMASRGAEELERAAAEIRQATGATVHTVAADVTTEEGRTKILAACEAPDILLNNAGGAPPGDFRDWGHDEWIGAVELMMLPAILMMRGTVDGMMERGFGRIVNIVSRSVKIPQLELGLSNGARSGLVGFTAGLARQTIRKGVTINNILPGIVDSDGQRDHIRGMLEEGGESFEEIWDRRAASNPAGRYGRPEEIGAWFAFLCSHHSGFVTGQNLLVDGGSYPGTY
ncbi:SDR family oxidoreductase [Roseicyclus sp. F158]|uniref:SDR family oxidoreductase n=1 Tax=Tropicimonas omnivorans TaxID=3075590 RepID=A0ABU3DMM9_9RHOB|nr:SDR family oxidoreductase [Roseicyclus sp. F158]MDT0684357.1 SDR family oxidoreductase [Roseicyclus sp. F158]